jgi:hypothetical protein
MGISPVNGSSTAQRPLVKSIITACYMEAAYHLSMIGLGEKDSPPRAP